MSASDTVYLYVESKRRPVLTSHICGFVRQRRPSLSGENVRSLIRYLEREGHLRRVEVDGHECWECVPESWAVYTGDPVGVP